jgi:nicotinamidase-related amidase
MPDPDAALLLVDMQKESHYGIEGVDDAVVAADNVLTDWRAAGLPVVYTRHVNRADATGLTIGEVLDSSGLPVHYRAGTPAVDIVDAIAPQQQDVVIDKHRWSGFYGTSLDLLLRSLGVGRLFVGGFTTDCCVLTTVFDACARDYRVSLVPDMCAATNMGSHQAAVLMMANWVYGIEILAASELSQKLAGSAYRSWRATAPDQKQFVAATLESSYESLLSQ